MNNQQRSVVEHHVTMGISITAADRKILLEVELEKFSHVYWGNWKFQGIQEWSLIILLW